MKNTILGEAPVLASGNFPQPLSHECSFYCAKDGSQHTEVIYSIYPSNPIGVEDRYLMLATMGMHIVAIEPAREAPSFPALFKMRGYSERICIAALEFPYPFAYLMRFEIADGATVMDYKQHSAYLERRHLLGI